MPDTYSWYHNIVYIHSLQQQDCCKSKHFYLYLHSLRQQDCCKSKHFYLSFFKLLCGFQKRNQTHWHIKKTGFFYLWREEMFREPKIQKLELQYNPLPRSNVIMRKLCLTYCHKKQNIIINLQQVPLKRHYINNSKEDICAGLCWYNQ